MHLAGPALKLVDRDRTQFSTRRARYLAERFLSALREGLEGIHPPHDRGFLRFLLREAQASGHSFRKRNSGDCGGNRSDNDDFGVSDWISCMSSRCRQYDVQNGDLSCELGLAFEVAAIVGVPLFGRELRCSPSSTSTSALLPKTVRPTSEEVDDDF